ncbi:NAD(P)-dependent oxidoreductase [Metabacillus malikii]|uniref:precorrin-2 dehydrogenase n=1 Tax=Metabacillus malikii TaxID=1504265 RepID=A0ABT9ZMY3_9BACI|nr:NAD(P)-dependent oxidoreductase [Metabacillus malikii]MDQ0233634.1 precorrin-2 dehydrogenase/sirohydrochlorin ferrochelatase [Metabacillus malikii]
MIPLHIDVNEREVVIVGGGSIAYRRLCLFLNEGALITVVSPTAVKEIEDLQRLNLIKWVKKKVDLNDVKHAFLIVAATNDPSINDWLAKNINEYQLINNASNAENGNVTVPKTVKKGRLTLSISTGGASPKLSKQLSEQLITQFDEQFIEQLDQLYEQRQRLKKNNQ